MRYIVIALLCFASFVLATDEPLIPAPLNALLPKITAGMTPEDVQAVLRENYPKAERQHPAASPRPDQTVYVGFRLDDRFSLTVATQRDSNLRDFVSKDARIFVFDRQRNQGLEITPSKGPRIAFDKTDYDLGTVTNNADIWVYEIPVQNTGDADLDVAWIRSGVGTTPHLRVSPGSTGKIVITNHYANIYGRRTNHVDIITNDPRNLRVPLTVYVDIHKPDEK
jgi:hypothetical protein